MNQSIALPAPEIMPPAPQDRAIKPTLPRMFGIAMSIIVLAAAIWQMRSVSLGELRMLVPSQPLFWLVFSISYLVGPVSDWIIFRRLWHIGPAAFGALIRKLIYNELLVGYIGEVYFYSWARRHLPLAASPFGAVKDVAVLSAVVGNVLTLAFLATAFPLLRLLPLHDHATAIGWSLAFVIGSSLAVMAWRGAIFSLDRIELGFVTTAHVARVLVTTALSALLWHLVLPDTPIGWWLLLATIRLLISRLPFVPNKDLVFAGIAVLAVGHDQQLASLMAMMAGLILVTHIIVGTSLALADLINSNFRGAEA